MTLGLFYQGPPYSTLSLYLTLMFRRNVPRSGDYLCARGTRPRAHSYEGSRRPASRGPNNMASLEYAPGGSGGGSGGGNSPRMGKMRENAHNNSALLNPGEEPTREKRNTL